MAENTKKENTFKPKPQPIIVSEEPMDTPFPEPKAPKKTKEPKEPKKKTVTKTEKKDKNKERDPRISYVFGFLLLSIALFLAISLLSFFVSFLKVSYHLNVNMLFGK